MEETPQIQPRGGCLTVFLIAVMIVNPLTSLSYLFLAPRIQQNLPFLPSWAIPVLIGLGIMNFVFGYAVWKWQRWGVIGFTLSSLVALAINFMSRLNPISLGLGLLGPIILIALVKDHWKAMK